MLDKVLSNVFLLHGIVPYTASSAPRWRRGILPCLAALCATTRLQSSPSEITTVISAHTDGDAGGGKVHISSSQSSSFHACLCSASVFHHIPLMVHLGSTTSDIQDLLIIFRGTKGEKWQPKQSAVDFLQHCSPQSRKQIEASAKHSSPDLSDL